MAFVQTKPQLKTLKQTAELVAMGISKQELAKMVADGRMYRVRQGYYMSSEEFHAATEESLVAGFFPDAIVCRESALYYYGYTNRTPVVWHLAFARNVSRSRLKASPVSIRPYFHIQRLFEVGVSAAGFNDTVLRVYDRERVICDCFSRRTSMDAEVFSEAIQAYVADADKNLANLSKYASLFGISKAVESVMGVLIHA